MIAIADRSIELKEGIVWSVDTTARKCGVRVLGSTDTLTVPFPPSWSVVPSWIQLSCPVQMRYRRGHRNSLEIIGPGHTIPTPTTGNYSPTPQSSDLDDGILSGCAISEIPLEPQMGVLVQTGSIRIAGSTIAITAIKANSTYYKADMGGYINDVAAAIQISAAPTAHDEARYDLIAAGTDAVIDLVTGTTFKTTATAATVPSLSAGHIELGRILISPQKTIIRNSDINAFWSPVVPHALSITADTTDLSSTQSTAAITVTVLDKYKKSITKDIGYGWRITLEIANGNGYIASTEGTSTASIGAYSGTSAGYTFTYTRLGTADDSSPLLTARLIAPAIENNFSLLLRDASGEIMTS